MSGIHNYIVFHKPLNTKVVLQFYQTMDQYLETTTVHGFSYVSGRNSKYTRIFWTVIIVTVFSLTSFLIIESIHDWEKHQTITTLKSIATPIQEVQFPTITVCPHEDTPPDNWSFLEKFLNALAFSGPTALSQKVIWRPPKIADSDTPPPDFCVIKGTIP